MLGRWLTTFVWSGMFALIATLSTTRGFAQDSRTARARALFQQGAAHAEEDRWQQALRAFERSSALLGHARTTYNIGYCERGLGHHTRARHFFERALEEHEARGAELSPDQAEAAANYIAEANRYIAEITIRGVSSTSTLRVDGRPLTVRGTHHVAGVADPGHAAVAGGQDVLVIEVDPGRRVFELGDGVRSQEQIVTVQRGERRKLTLRPLANAPAKGGSQPAPPASAPATDHKRMTHVGWAIGLGGAGVALGGVAGVLVALSASTWSEARAACPQTTRCPDDLGFELSNQARFEARLATAASVTAGAALAGGLVLWLTAPDAPDDASRTLGLRIGVGHLSLRGEF